MKAIFSHCDLIMGDGESLLIHNKADMGHFKKTTMAGVVICGRVTLESLPAKLQGRKTIVVTRDEGYTHPFADVVCHSRQDVLNVLPNGTDVWVIGGAAIYDLFRNDIDEMIVTEFHEHMMPKKVGKPIRIPLRIRDLMDWWDEREVERNGDYTLLSYTPAHKR